MPISPMIPISDNILNSRKPIVIYWLIGVNISLFFLEIKLALGDQLGDAITSWGLIPSAFSAAIANALSGNPSAWIFVLMHSASLVIGIFLHSSFSQILGNLIFLLVFGKTLENIIGRSRFLGFYLVSGVLTSFVQILIDPNSTTPVIGGNGVIASILGAYVLKFPKRKIDTIVPLVILFIPLDIPAFVYVFWWFVQQMFYGIGSLNIPYAANQSFSSYLAQFVGLLFGASFMRLLKQK
jgi:membrane associated rhomboid family serine protease